jgi:hypothetical protein
MTPTAASSILVAPGPAPLGVAAKTSPAGAVPPAAPKPDLGSAAVTQAEATAKTAMGAPGHAHRPVPEIPPDPPPVKGLGVPPLDTSQVGDLDRSRETGPPAMSDLLAAIQAPGTRDLDRRL